MTAAIAVLMAGVATFTACDKDDDDKKEEKQEQSEKGQKEKVVPEGYVDLGLPSGTYWKDQNEEKLYTYQDAIEKFENSLPNNDQLEELRKKCQWTWDSTNKGATVTGPNGNSIFLPAAGFGYSHSDKVTNEGIWGCYWSSVGQPYTDYAYFLEFGWSEELEVVLTYDLRSYKRSVRLVQ